MLCIAFLTLSVLLFSINAQDCSQPPPRGVHALGCCPVSFPTAGNGNIEDCRAPAEHGESGGPGSHGRHKGPSCEEMQCLMKKDGILTADNKIDKAAFKTFFEQNYSAEWKPVIAKAIAACDADTDKTDNCEVRRYVFCFKHNVFINCPASIFVQSADCSALKAFMEKCPKPTPPQ